MTVLFTSQRPLSRCENIKAIYDAYDGSKQFLQLDLWRQHPEITDYPLMVTDEIPAKSGGEVIFVPHGIEGTKTYGLDQPNGYASENEYKLITYAICQSKHTVDLMAQQLGLSVSQVLPLGMPRTDGYKRKKAQVNTYLYVPTFESRQSIDWQKMDDMMFDDEMLVVKPHMLGGKLLDREYKHIVEASRDVPTAPYLESCSVLITDFSSVMLDGLCARIPVVLYGADRDYLARRGMYYKYPEAYSSYHADNEMDLIAALRTATWQDEDKREFFCGMCDGHSTERIIDFIKQEANMAGKKRGTKTKAEKVEKLAKEVTEEAEKYVEAQEQDQNQEFPVIVLPCRGYFRKWDFGDNVKNLQIAMNRLMLTGITENGEYDDDTMKAVEQFEKKYGGYVNGKFGREELAAYNKLRGTK